MRKWTRFFLSVKGPAKGRSNELRHVSLAINYGLCCLAVMLLCLILSYERLDRAEGQVGGLFAGRRRTDSTGQMLTVKPIAFGWNRSKEGRN